MKKLPQLILSVAVLAAGYDTVQAQQPSHMQAAKVDRWRNTMWPFHFAPKTRWL